MNPIGVRLPVENLAANMESRLTKMSAKDSARLDTLMTGQPLLRNFFQQAIAELEQTKDGDSHTQIAHFLMGRSARLPETLAAWVRETGFQPAPELATMLDDVLRSSRFGLVKEDSTKTLAKLQNLSARMEKVALPAAFRGNPAHPVPTESVADWMHSGESNPWLPASVLGARKQGDHKAEMLVTGTKPINGLIKLKNIHVHIGKITDLKANGDTKAAILLRSTPDLLLGNGHAASKAVMHADGAEIQAALFRDNGLPLPAPDNKKYTAPAALKMDDAGNFSAKFDANDMKSSHGMDEIGIFGSAQYESAGSANKAAEKLGHDLLDMSYLLLPMQDFTHDPYNAVALALQNPARQVILVIDPSDGYSDPRTTVTALVDALKIKDKEAANLPGDLTNLA